MEIPYTVKARPDTGLYNAKIGVWLFLASEVMLFGGLFSGYIFLRLGASDGHWPQGLLSVPVGLLNTFILISSSVTVVFAWAALKMRKFGQFQAFMAATVFLGLLFLGIKFGYEYPAKFKHFGAILKKESVGKYEEFLGNEYLAGKGLGSRVEITGHLENPEALTDPSVTEYEIQVDPVHADPKNPAFDRPSFFPHPAVDKVVKVAKEDVHFASMFVPKHNAFFSSYFVVTGLHGLHIIGGLIIFIYSLLPASAALYRKDPEHLANRIEVGGLYWHFVDLVWIIVFPVFYLL